MSKLECIEDWKNTDKINAIKKLINTGQINQYNIKSYLGKNSKKTYNNGIMIDDSTLAHKKFLDPEIKEYNIMFHKKIEGIIDPTEIIQIIQSEIVCRDKYNNNTLDQYKNRIQDIIYTRDIEESLYLMLYRKSYNKLINDMQHNALKFILYNSWEDTMIEYTWLTKLITYVNNGSMDAKQYLLDLGAKDSANVNDIIIDICRIQKLNMNHTNVIVSFIHSIGKYFKHGTYIKWYNKEYDFIKLFMENKDNTLEFMIKDYDDIIKYMLTKYYNKLYTSYCS